MKKINPSSSKFLQNAKALALKFLLVGAFFSLGIGLTLAVLEDLKTNWKTEDIPTASSINALAEEMKVLKAGVEVSKNKILKLKTHINEIGETAWLGGRHADMDTGFRSYTKEGDSSLFDCQKLRGYCIAKKDGAFISGFANATGPSGCPYSLRINAKKLSPSTGDYYYYRGQVSQTLGGIVSKGDMVGWHPNNNTKRPCWDYLGDAGFTLVTINNFMDREKERLAEIVEDE
jgi:hypothetical protein